MSARLKSSCTSSQANIKSDDIAKDELKMLFLHHLINFSNKTQNDILDAPGIEPGTTPTFQMLREYYTTKPCAHS